MRSTGQAHDASFVPRGKITLEIDGKSEPKLTVENQQNVLSEADVSQMMRHGWYQLQLVEDAGSEGAPPPVLTTVPACRMRLANFR